MLGFLNPDLQVQVQAQVHPIPPSTELLTQREKNDLSTAGSVKGGVARIRRAEWWTDELIYRTRTRCGPGPGLAWDPLDLKGLLERHHPVSVLSWDMKLVNICPPETAEGLQTPISLRHRLTVACAHSKKCVCVCVCTDGVHSGQMIYSLMSFQPDWIFRPADLLRDGACTHTDTHTNTDTHSLQSHLK